MGGNDFQCTPHRGHQQQPAPSCRALADRSLIVRRRCRDDPGTHGMTDQHDLGTMPLSVTFERYLYGVVQSRHNGGLVPCWLAFRSKG